MKIAELIFVALILAGLVPFLIAFFIQQFKLPSNMRGAWPSSFRSLSQARRDRNHSAHKLVRVYLISMALFATFMAGALVAWQFIDVATKA